ncbi:hypothetical protein HPB52_013930 [Rhipicephalus sanguineus]|uniref:Uncharacterized protein n=1 Tax=Rhipicephalus sanguineus TaxID=34632 RepID=A0A9D4PKJ4_RHISA|nr:hypothetical protein HPB52_013930 [Rhipicephalus sanguineus]
MKNALSRSCLHKIHRSFNDQLKRLKDSGFPEPLLSTFIEVLVRDIRCPKEKSRIESKKRLEEQRSATSVPAASLPVVRPRSCQPAALSLDPIAVGTPAD